LGEPFGIAREELRDARIERARTRFREGERLFQPADGGYARLVDACAQCCATMVGVCKSACHMVRGGREVLNGLE
jgi:hypothetical protein